MRVADYVIEYLEGKGIDHAFTVVGGGAIFLCDALAKAKRMKYIACHHEQAAAMAAEAYARVRTGFGLAVVTSGPGGTNAITGVAGAWLDHVPTITLSGQSFSNQMIDRKDRLAETPMTDQHTKPGCPHQSMNLHLLRSRFVGNDDGGHRLRHSFLTLPAHFKPT